MRNWFRRLGGIACVLFGTAAAAQAQVCITVDSAADTFLPSERQAAVLLLTRQLENAGERVLAAGCPREYTVSHVRLGETIVVQLSGPEGRWEATAETLDDLPALYSQMARSIVTGRPMSGFNVVDRTNVTATQSTARRFHTDSIWYARLGQGALFANNTYGTPALGFGYRAELDSFAIDVSFLNLQFSTGRSSWSSGAAAQTWLKLSGLYFFNPLANRSPYLGGGLSYGHQSFGGSYDSAGGYYTSGWRGSGLQGELTAGYEMARVTNLRVFVQADALIPFYQSTSETYPIRPIRPGIAVPTVDTRRAPSLVVSIGLGR
jgi:hypothetical protein